MDTRYSLRLRRKRRVRALIHGTGQRPRLSVYRSHQWMEAQFIDDEAQHTLLGKTERALKPVDIPEGFVIPKETKQRRAWLLGWTIAKEAVSKGMTSVVFDRGGYAYHGRVKALAEGARAGGLRF